MSKFATGKNALGISDRSGFRYPLRRMRMEWTGMLVGYDEWEAKQPQLLPLRKVKDAQALKNPRPDRVEPLLVYVGISLVQLPDVKPLVSFGQVGGVTVTTS